MLRVWLLASLLVLVEGRSAHVSTLELDDELPSRGRLGGLSVGPDGVLYVSDFRSTTWRVTPDGAVEVLDSSLRGTSGNTVDSNGNFYQSSFRDDRVVRIDEGGAVTDVATEGLDGPVGLVADGSGNLYVCNCGGDYIAKVDPAGGVTRFAESIDFDCPNGIALDPNGFLVVVSFNNGFVVRVAPDGDATTWVEVPEGRNAHVVATEHMVYVTKIESNRIYAIDPVGGVTPFAGSGELGFEDGPAFEASLSRPNGIAVSPDGRALYVNNLDGLWRGSEPTTIVIRRIELP